MLGRVTAGFSLLLLLISSDAAAGCSLTPRYSGQFRTTALDVSIDSAGFVWVATGYGVQLLEPRRGSAPAIVDSVAVAGTTSVIRVANDVGYAGSGTRVHVLQREDRSIRIIGSVATGGIVNAIALAGSYLFVATSQGIEHYLVADPAAPIRTSAVLSTSSPNVTSLAVDSSRSVLYAADGDASVEIFSIASAALPQQTGTLATVAGASAVHTPGDGYVVVSDRFGRNTDLFAGITYIARIPFGATALAAWAPQTYFFAGGDRTLRALDVSVPSRIATLFERDLVPSGGSDNVIHAIARSADAVYIAAGDIGLVTLDVPRLVRPWPLVSYSSGATRSVVMGEGRAWFAGGDGEISEQKIVPEGLTLTPTRSWAGGSIVHDLRDSSLLASSGSTATIWTITGEAPAAASTSTFGGLITAAALHESGVVAQLADGTVWQTGTTTRQLPLSGIGGLARAGDAYTFVEARADGTTHVHYYASGDFATPTRTIVVPGAAVNGVATNTTHAAVFTFRGINLIDLSTGHVSVIAGSQVAIPQQLAFAGDDLLAIADRRLFVYDGGTLIREHALPVEATAVDAARSPEGTAVFATSRGTAAMAYRAEIPSPMTPFVNRFYRDAAVASGRLYLLGDDAIGVYSTVTGEAPAHVTSIPAAGIIGIAATDAAFFTLAANGTVTSRSRAGAQLAQMALDEGTEVTPRAIHAAGGAVWVSLTRGCSAGACEGRTVVLDPVTLMVTSAMTGAVEDVVTSGRRAYALVTIPDEIRTIEISQPLHPLIVAAAARPEEATSIAASGGTVYVAGRRIHSYSEATLAAGDERLTPVLPHPSQMVRIAGDCAIVTGRAASPELYTLPDWTPAASAEVPSAARAIALQDGRVLLLTERSIEIWSATPAASPARRRSVR